MSKKIAIMTWHTYNNYGGVLQAYALRAKLIQLGIEQVDFVNYIPTGKPISFIEKYSLKNILEMFLRKKYARTIEDITEKEFDDFRKKNISVTKACNTKSELYSLNNEYDTFICGSDQIWAPSLFDENYFLKFVDNNDKKIAYAPSIGLDTIEDEYIKEMMSELISNISCLSIREERGQKLIKEITGRDAKLVLDPTFLLSKKEWNTIFDLEHFDEKDYILVYCLGDMKKAYKIAKKFKKRIIVIPRFYRDYMKYYNNIVIPSPEEFLKLIYNANMVITDSFHGTIFSMNFNVPFITLKRFNDNKKSQNSRIYSILKIMNLEKRLYNNNERFFIHNDKIDFKEANQIISKKRIESINFLVNSLNIENNLEMKKDLVTNVCAGCGVCAAACPQKCIQIKLNEEGFYEYDKDESKCINCNICKVVCAQLKNQKITLKDKQLFSFYSNEGSVLSNSSSGGFAHEISKWGIKKGYSVVGCTYDHQLKKAKHIIVRDISELYKLSGSKYLQSYTYDTFKEILNLEKSIIIGTPCQIASLDNWLKMKNRRDDFILVDLICHGVPSYLLWESYLSTKKEISNVKFRDKKNGWRVLTLTTNGKKFEKQTKSLFYDFFLRGNIYADSCYECNYRDSSCADIRIGDFWGPKFVDNKTGVSMVISCTSKGILTLKMMQKDSCGAFNKEDISHYFRYQQTENIKAPYERVYILNDMKEKKPLKKISNKYCKKYRREVYFESLLKTLYVKFKKIYIFMKKGN